MTSIPPPGMDPSPDGGWGYRASDREPTLDPLSQRLLQIVIVLSVLLILAVVDAWLHSGGGNPIAEAAERTEQFPGTRTIVEAIYSSSASSRRVVMRGRGVSNSKTGRSQVVMMIPAPLETVRMKAIGDRRTIFLRSSLPNEGLPPGKRWMAIEPLLGRTPETAFGGSSAQGSARHAEGGER